MKGILATGLTVCGPQTCHPDRLTPASSAFPKQMKKAIFTFLAAVCGVFAVSNLDRGSLLTNAQAPEKKGNSTTFSNEKDREMASELKRLTNRETTLLSQKHFAYGIALDLDGGFHSVALLRSEPDGDS